MSWLAKLYETYNQALSFDLSEENTIMPVSHTKQNAHINIALDSEGNFRRAEVLEKTQIILPATENSAGRSSGEAAHPLADKVQYVAGDYKDYGGKKPHYFKSYKKQLEEWCESEWFHPKSRAVLSYISNGTVIKDLVDHNILYVDHNTQKLLTNWSDRNEKTPLIFKVLPKEDGSLDQGSALICWTVEIADDPCSETWRDKTLHESWIKYYSSIAANNNALCFVTGKVSLIASNHPAKLRNTGDKAKLISSNDNDGFTYRGRFIEFNQALNISYEVTQKAHNALRWLISRTKKSGFNGEQVVIAWAISGKNIPCPTDDFNKFDLDDLDPIDTENELDSTLDHSVDLGQSFAKKLSNYMTGYREKLNPTEDIIVMVIDSATPGRMGIVYYREFFAEKYLEKIEKWYQDFAWPQRITRECVRLNGKKEKTFIIWPPGSPSPYSILHTAYGDIIKSSETLKKNLYERILSCVIDEQQFPQDLLNLAIRRASNPNACEKWEWEKNIGVACALYRGFCKRHSNQQIRRNYAMTLETDCVSRDYLYGRLLAIAERIEEISLNISKENRPTNAERLMQRFADRPFSTWRIIELALSPYMQRLHNLRPAFLVNRKKELDEVKGLFNRSDFIDDKALSGEFLLAYHCQRQALRNEPESINANNEGLNNELTK